MGNNKSMAVRNAIITLYGRGWKKSRIARELDIDRGTVARHVRLAADMPEILAISEDLDSKPAKVPAGYCRTKPAKVHAGSDEEERGRRSHCKPYQEQIEQALEGGLTAQRIFQDMVIDYGFEGSYDSVKRFVRSLKKTYPKRIWRIEVLPGEEAQVDFGTGAWLVSETGKKRRSWVFRITLSHSRKSYSEAVLHQTTENFIRCLENAFRAFGGVPDTLVIDNLRAAVDKADWYEPDLNPKIESFCQHYDTVILPARARKPEHKGKVESGIKYVKNNALKRRKFGSLNEENQFLSHWEETIADTRIHGTTRRQVRKLFQEVEKPALKALPISLFPCFEEGRRTVHRDSYVEVAKAYYQVPEEYIGRQVWTRWDSRTVRVFNNRFEQISICARKDPGQFSEHLHARGRRCSSVERDTAWWLSRARRMGEASGTWAMEVVGARGVTGIRSLQGLIGLARKHSWKAINGACELALSHGAYRLKDIKRLIHVPVKQESFEFMDSHPIIREMSEYTAFMDVLYPQETIYEEARV